MAQKLVRPEVYYCQFASSGAVGVANSMVIYSPGMPFSWFSFPNLATHLRDQGCQMQITTDPIFSSRSHRTLSLWTGMVENHI